MSTVVVGSRSPSPVLASLSFLLPLALSEGDLATVAHFGGRSLS